MDSFQSSFSDGNQLRLFSFCWLSHFTPGGGREIFHRAEPELRAAPRSDLRLAWAPNRACPVIATATRSAIQRTLGQKQGRRDWPKVWEHAPKVWGEGGGWTRKFVWSRRGPTPSP